MNSTDSLTKLIQSSEDGSDQEIEEPSNSQEANSEPGSVTLDSEQERSGSRRRPDPSEYHSLPEPSDFELSPEEDVQSEQSQLQEPSDTDFEERKALLEQADPEEHASQQAPSEPDFPSCPLSPFGVFQSPEKPRTEEYRSQESREDSEKEQSSPRQSQPEESDQATPASSGPATSEPKTLQAEHREGIGMFNHQHHDGITPEIKSESSEDDDYYIGSLFEPARPPTRPAKRGLSTSLERAFEQTESPGSEAQPSKQNARHRSKSADETLNSQRRSLSLSRARSSSVSGTGRAQRHTSPDENGKVEGVSFNVSRTNSLPDTIRNTASRAEVFESLRSPVLPQNPAGSGYNEPKLPRCGSKRPAEFADEDAPLPPDLGDFDLTAVDLARGACGLCSHPFDTVHLRPFRAYNFRGLGANHHDNSRTPAKKWGLAFWSRQLVSYNHDTVMASCSSCPGAWHSQCIEQLFRGDKELLQCPRCSVYW